MWSSLAFWGGSGRETKGKERVSWLIDARTHTHTLNNAQSHSKYSWLVCVRACACVWVGGWLRLSVHAAHMWVSAGLNVLYLKNSLPLQFLNKAAQWSGGGNTRESIIQLSRFPLSLQTQKNSVSDHRIGVGAGERDCFFISTNFVLTASTVLSIPLAGSRFFQRQKCEG